MEGLLLVDAEFVVVVIVNRTSPTWTEKAWGEIKGFFCHEGNAGLCSLAWIWQTLQSCLCLYELEYGNGPEGAGSHHLPVLV